MKIFFLPTISASLPKGRRKITDERIKLLAIHPSSIAVVLKSLAIAGKARLIAEPRKGVRKAANEVTIKTDLFSVLSSARMDLFLHKSLFFVFGVNNNCYRSVIDQANFHHCPEFPCCDYPFL